jgi:hypothetical protein
VEGIEGYREDTGRYRRHRAVELTWGRRGDGGPKRGQRAIEDREP